MKPSDCIFFQLSKAAQNATRFWSQRVSGLGVTAVQGLFILFLADRDGITSRELGDQIQLDSATLTGIIDRLEAQGLVRRIDHPEDRRAVLLYLTDEGKRIGGELAGIAREANREFLQAFSPEEEQDFRRFLGVVRTVP
jgi:DNA-binding MarR family transcriptional regulator